jgi:lipoprotein NlpD
VTVAKSGKVVYAGKGLEAYGLLIIVKHDAHYLSAYAYNKSASVKEGDSVRRGQQIARMGTKGGQAMLHFEIRRDGKTVDPRTLLPRR